MVVSKVSWNEVEVQIEDMTVCMLTYIQESLSIELKYKDVNQYKGINADYSNHVYGSKLSKDIITTLGVDNSNVFKDHSPASDVQLQQWNQLRSGKRKPQD